MKSERRHELQHNELADWMVTLGTTLKPYANLLLGAVLVLAIVGVGWTFVARQSSKEAARAWEDFYAAMANGSFAELNNIAEDYPEAEAAQWARVTLGDLRLREGCSALFTSRAEANEELDKARKSYEAALAATSNPAIRQQANFGLARAWEAQGKLDRATEFYDKLAKIDGPYAAVAQARIKALASPAIRSFYDEFAEFDPKPAYQPGPLGSLGLDNLGNLELPGPGESLFPNQGSAGVPAEPSEESSPATEPQPAVPSSDAASPPAAPAGDAPKEE